MPELNIANAYPDCLEIPASSYNQGLAPLPSKYMYRLATCCEKSCDVTGYGSRFYVSKSKLIAREPFLVCENCAKKETENVLTLNKCISCHRELTQHMLRNKSYVKDVVSGIEIYTCEYCAEKNKLNGSYRPCHVCSNYYETESYDSYKKSPLCNDCTQNYKKCKCCDQYHVKNEKRRNQIVTGQMYPPSHLVTVFCTANQQARLKVTQISILLDRELSKLASV